MANREQLRIFVPVLAVLMIASASAFAKNRIILNVPFPASVNGKHLDPGQYKVSWETHSRGATVTFAKRKNVAATAEAKLVERDVKYKCNAIVDNTKADGSQTIVEIRLGGSKQALVFGE